MTEAGQALVKSYYKHEIETEFTKQQQIGAAKSIAATTGEPREPGTVITLDDINDLSKEEKIKMAKISLGPKETKKEVISPYKNVTFDEFKRIIDGTINIEDLDELGKHISESEATTPRQRIELHKIVEQKSDTLREGDLFSNVKDNCSEWDFSTFEVMLAGSDKDELEEMLDCVMSSTKLADAEIETLKNMIEKKMEE